MSAPRLRGTSCSVANKRIMCYAPKTSKRVAVAAFGSHSIKALRKMSGISQMVHPSGSASAPCPSASGGRRPSSVCEVRWFIFSSMQAAPCPFGTIAASCPLTSRMRRLRLKTSVRRRFGPSAAPLHESHSRTRSVGCTSAPRSLFCDPCAVRVLNAVARVSRQSPCTLTGSRSPRARGLQIVKNAPLHRCRRALTRENEEDRRPAARMYRRSGADG